MPYKDKNSDAAKAARVRASTSWRERNRERDRANNNRRRAEKKQFLVNHLGGECVGCGSKNDLQFDHIVRADKTFTIGQCMWKKMDVLIEEANKCQLLCKKCHELKGVCYNDWEKLEDGYRVEGIETIGDKVIVTLQKVN